jgi:hypothetical protein
MAEGAGALAEFGTELALATAVLPRTLAAERESLLRLLVIARKLQGQIESGFNTQAGQPTG